MAGNPRISEYGRKTRFNATTAVEAKKKSDEAKQRKKNMREIISLWMEAPTKAAEFKKMKKSVGVDDDSNTGVLVAAAIYHGMRGNYKYMEMLMQFSGEVLGGSDNGVLESILALERRDDNVER